MCRWVWGAGKRCADSVREMVDEVCGEQNEIVAALAQRRQGKRETGCGEKITAEALLCDRSRGDRWRWRR